MIHRKVKASAVTSSYRHIHVHSPNDSACRNENETMGLTRSALSRPFGRTSLPAHLAKRWVVQVSFAGFDHRIGACLYNVMVHVEDPESYYSSTPVPSPIRPELTHDSQSSMNISGIGGCGVVESSFVAASVDRTLDDFIWLEEALIHEYRGSLMFPLLSLAVTSWANDWENSSTELRQQNQKQQRQRQPQLQPQQKRVGSMEDPIQISMNLLQEALLSKEPIDTKLLADWMNDVLNSVRGKGEIILNHKMIEVIQSEAMETFLYKTASSLPKPMRNLWNDRLELSGSSILDFRSVLRLHESRKDCVQSTLAGIVRANLRCWGVVSDECGWNSGDDAHDADGILSQRNHVRSHRASGKGDGSVVDMESDGLYAQSFYIAVQKENTLRSMSSLKILLDKEIMLSAAWKRFAISLSMLFACEKDIEVCKVAAATAAAKNSASVKSVDKIEKVAVDDSLRILARQKVDRSIPSLKVLSGMLNAYYVDFSSVGPSLLEYAKSIERMVSTDPNDSGWQSQLKAVSTSPLKLLNIGTDASKVDSKQEKLQRRTMEQKLKENERHMMSSMTQFCKATKIRTCRMSWKYFKMELGQVSLLVSACEQLKANLKRSNAWNNDFCVDVEKADNDREYELVKLIMELGLAKKYKYNPIPKSCASSHTSSETSEVSDFDKSHEGADSETLTTDEGTGIQSKVFENMISLCKDYTGRWNADFTIKLLEASGIPDVSFDKQDVTSKSIRTVSKLSAALREGVERYQKAVEMLKEFIDENHENNVPMNMLRHNFLSDLLLVFSCTCHPRPIDSSWEHLLSSIDVDIHDSAGWLKRQNVRGGEQCGIVTMKYHSARNHASTTEFIASLQEKLKSYDLLLAEIENYIWMHRAGDYIEKYYSNIRAQALAAWEKKTDITTAINIATKKKLTLLVKELKEKLELIGDSVSYSSVKDAKERHLGSKAIKGELESLASRRFQRIKETCTGHSLSIIHEWALREESMAKVETKYLNEIIQEIESNTRRHEMAIKADGGAHLFACSLTRKSSSTRSPSQSNS